MTGVIESLEARIKVLEDRVALLEGRGYLPVLPYVPWPGGPPSTAYCPFCFGNHPGSPCPLYVVTCNDGNATPESAGGGV